MDSTNNQRRIRESAPFRKSMSMNQDDINTELELERLFTLKYPDEAPFTFSKTICKALGVAYETITSDKEPENKCKEGQNNGIKKSHKFFGKRKQ